MSGRKPEDEPSTSQGKGRRTNEDEQQLNVMANEAPNHLAIATVPNDGVSEIRPQIFKLDVDCVQEMFDWLSVENIHSVGETCTRMHRITGDYFQPNLVALELLYEHSELKKMFGIMNLNGFKGFVQKILIHESVNEEGYRFIAKHCKSLKQIKFDSKLELNAMKIEHIKPILKEIEVILICDIAFHGEFYETLLQFCPNLKRLCINGRSLNRAENSNVIIGVNNEWLFRIYPALESLELRFVGKKVPELGIFLDQNPLQKLTIDGFTLLLNMNTLLQSNTKLQLLAIDISKREENIYQQLKPLYDRGFYRRLHLNVIDHDQQAIDRISLLNVNGLEQLYLTGKTPRLNLNSLSNLKELGFNYFITPETFPIDSESTAKSLVNLERIYFDAIKSESIEPFIRYSVNLKAINIRHLEGEDFIDLFAWNKQREKLFEARKVTVYLREKEYLATKWNNKATDFKMIEAKRAESFDWLNPSILYYNMDR